MKLDLRNIPVYWINVENAKERATKMTDLLDRCGFTQHQRFNAATHENKVVGCALSHILALNEITDDMFILLEDDVLDTEHLQMEIDVPGDFDAFYLGTSYWPNDIQRARMSLLSNSTQKIKVNSSVYQISYMTGLHAVIYKNNDYKKEAMNSMLDWLHDPNGNLHCDVPTAKLQAEYKVYAPAYPFFFQSDKNNPENEFWTKKPLCEFE